MIKPVVQIVILNNQKLRQTNKTPKAVMIKEFKTHTALNPSIPPDISPNLHIPVSQAPPVVEEMPVEKESLKESILDSEGPIETYTSYDTTYFLSTAEKIN